MQTGCNRAQSFMKRKKHLYKVQTEENSLLKNTATVLSYVLSYDAKVSFSCLLTYQRIYLKVGFSVFDAASLMLP